jgi:hypothetical protein
MYDLPAEADIEALVEEAKAYVYAARVATPTGWTDGSDPVAGWCRVFYGAGAILDEIGPWMILTMPSNARWVMPIDQAVRALDITPTAGRWSRESRITR